MHPTAEEFDPYRKWLGILPKDQPPHHYRLLGIEPLENDVEVIEHAADQRMSHLRSLQVGKHAALSQKLLNEIAAAKLCLLNAERKVAYDLQLQQRLAEQQNVSNVAMLAPGASQSGDRPPVAGANSGVLVREPNGNSGPQSVAPATGPAELTEFFVEPSSNTQRLRPPKQSGVRSLILASTFTLAALALALVAYWQLSSPEPTKASTRPVANKPAERSPAPKPPSSPKPQPTDNAATRPDEAAKPAPEAVPDAATAAQAGAPSSDVVVEPHPSGLPDSPGSSTPDGPPGQASQAQSKIDLLERIDPARDSVQGQWERAGHALLSPPGEQWTRVQVPYTPPRAYVLTAVVERLIGKDSLTIGLVVGGAQPGVVLDGWQNQICGIAMVDSRFGDMNSTTVRIRDALAGGPHTIVVRVRPDQIEVRLDDLPLTRWQGDWHRLSIDSRLQMPRKDQLYLSTYRSRFRISRLELEPLDEQDSSAAVAVAPAASEDSEPHRQSHPAVDDDDGASEVSAVDEPAETQRPNATFVGPRPAGPKRVHPAVPDKAACEHARGLIDEIFKEELASAKKGEGRKALSAKLLEQAGQTTDDLPARYMLLSMSRDLAAEAGDAVAAVRAADELGRSFDVDPLLTKLDALASTSPAKIEAGARHGAAQMAMSLADACVERDDYEAATRAIKYAQSVSRMAKDASLVKTVNGRGRDVAALAKQFSAIQEHAAKLQTDPDDAAANTALGKWYCFSKSNWKKGLPLLAKGDDADLKSLAEREEHEPVTGAERASLGDDWWDLAEKQTEPATKRQYSKRAIYWYEQAQHSLQGLAKTKVEQRLTAGHAMARKNIQVSAKTYIGDAKRGLNAAAATGIRVREGQRVSITPTGKWQFAPNQNGGAEWLVVAVGSVNKPASQTVSGDQREFSVQQAGELFLGIRDKQTQDNQGHLDVEVVVH